MAVSSLVQASGGVTQKVDVFTSTGTWTAPANCFSVEVFMVGGGGGGGAARNLSNACSGGGGGGGCVVQSRVLSVTPGTSYTVTIGAGGAGATTDVTGADGSNSSFGTLLTVFGGGGGSTQRSTGTYSPPNAKGTVGGVSTNDGEFAGGGGGAAATYIPSRFNATTPFIAPADNDELSISDSIRGNVSSVKASIGGLGIEGFGGGGNPGWVNGQSTRWNKLSIHGGGVGGHSQMDGGNAAANFGGGGGGASKAGTTQARNGGNGGSGYAAIIYWS